MDPAFREVNSFNGPHICDLTSGSMASSAQEQFLTLCSGETTVGAQGKLRVVPGVELGSAVCKGWD